MKALLTLLVLAQAATANATSFGSGGTFTSGPSPIYFPWQCKRADLSACTTGDLADPSKRHVVILPTGFSAEEETTFWTQFDRTITAMTTAGWAWSVQKRNQLLYIGWFDPSGPLDSPTATFQAKVPNHPIRGKALSLVNEQVFAKVNSIRGTLTNLRPFGALVIFNYTGPRVTANASPPNFIDRPYGIAKMTVTDLDDRGSYLPVHELGHAALNFLDEYIEDGFEESNIHSLDALTPLASFDGSWTGFSQGLSDLVGYYDMQFSEILANNGNENISTLRYPSTVWTPGFTGDDYSADGGMFFGKGSHHMPGGNVMGDGQMLHTLGQQRVVNEAFGAPASRPNDRLRAAGPAGWWPATLGPTTKVMISDGDKRHLYHPTRTYNVQVAWVEREWHTCWKVIFPYPCSTDTWKYAEKSVWSQTRKIQLKLTLVWGIAQLVQKIACTAGFEAINSNGSTFRLCDADLKTVADQFLPTLLYALPFQEISVPASQWMTTYYWRFSTNNGRYQSGYTGWSSFFRSL